MPLLLLVAGSTAVAGAARRTPVPAPLLLVYGRADLAAPRYDLALLSPFVLGQRASTIEAAPERGADGADVPAGGAPTLVSPAIFWGVLGLAVVVLLGVVARLVRRET